ncbi:sirohydrochlorin chelatase [Streptomyces sp. NPDC004646]
MSAAPTLLAVAHGTRDPQGVRTVHALLDKVRRTRPGLRVRVAWLDLVEPSVPHALAELRGPAVAVPLLLASGYHVRTDLPTLLADATPTHVRVAPALGPSPLLARALAARLAEAGRPVGGAPVVLAAAGSSDPRARADTAESARLLAAHLNAPVTAAFAVGEGPSPAEAVAAWRSAGHPDVALATHLLAPGHFARHLTGTGARWTAAPLGAQRWVAELVLRRYDEGVRGRSSGSSARPALCPALRSAPPARA